MSLLHHAVIYQRPGVVDTILVAAPESVNVQDYLKRSPLHYAAMCPPGTEIYQTLVNAQADDSFADVMGKSPLDYASEPNEALLEEAKAKIEQSLKVKPTSPAPTAEEGKQDTSATEDKSSDQIDKSGEQAQAEIDVPAPATAEK
ncbi:hypothetical protein EGW08_014296, partial [Elysia chlorotica]